MIYSAFALGIMGSLHCVGMCGPLVSALPFNHLSPIKSLFAKLLYHSSRVFTYALIGFLFGGLGFSVNLLTGQQTISIIMSIILLISVFFPAYISKYGSVGLMGRFNIKVKKQLGQLIRKNGFLFYVLSGMLNALLPCGLVWVAIASSLAIGNYRDSSLFMLFFGLGTIPALIGFQTTFKWISKKLPIPFYRLSNALILLIAVLLFMRGMNLGNYFSPSSFDFELAKDRIISACGF